ncbi:prolipoprotein diacylglyceryl transferase [Sulfoacidibacillus thermotolerans]|uniref:Phosphatidylglycerol--prolipoprotein diacylglyceryl transferase n=1 Tax=Sulfoacidibacillus thermotolerans TaxID=1765684 RepID=A0A2U3D9G1_SULT2|nr:prolipoprotein diacylglyceryl transferase [Sulfoacidibacillus thermotolerans]PWI57914.1 prolipoprotein diacylglyceryl transferase [Sulfoacidibacillus thermotolerans]
MHQYWFFIGSFPVRTYSTLFLLAFLLGLGVTLYFAKVERKSELIDHILNLGPILFIGGLIGSRIWQVFFFDWSYYRSHPDQILAIWHGGLSIQGGIVGSLLAGWIYVYKHRLNFWELADLFAPGIILGQSIGRDANLLNGDAFGSPTGGDFGLLFPQGTLARMTYGDQPLWPAEVWEGQGDMIIFALLLLFKLRRWPRGFIFLLQTTLYNIERFLLEMLRGDSPRFLFHWDAAQWTSALIIALCAVLFPLLARLDQRRLRHLQTP